MRHELTDYEWAAIKPLLPNKLRGVSPVNDRVIVSVHPHGACIADNAHQDMGRSQGGLRSKIYMIHSPADIAAACPTTVTRSRWLRAFTRMTQ